MEVQLGWLHPVFHYCWTHWNFFHCFFYVLRRVQVQTHLKQQLYEPVFSRHHADFCWALPCLRRVTCLMAQAGFKIRDQEQVNFITSDPSACSPSIPATVYGFQEWQLYNSATKWAWPVGGRIANTPLWQCLDVVCLAAWRLAVGQRIQIFSSF